MAVPQWVLYGLLVVMVIVMYFFESSDSPSGVLDSIEDKFRGFMRWLNRQ